MAQEHFAAAWAHQVGGSVTSLRYHNVYGPGMPRDTPYAGVASIFRSALEHGRAPTVYEDGRQLRDFVHLSDVVQANELAILRATDSPAGTEVIACNVGSGQPQSVGDFARLLAAEMAGPAPVVVGGGRAGDVRHVVADTSLAVRILGYRPRVMLDDGIAEFATTQLRGSSAHRRRCEYEEDDRETYSR